MIEYYVKNWYSKLLLHPVIHLLPNSISPNTITAISLLLGLTVPLALFYSLPAIAILCLLLSGLCDSLDSEIARLHNQTSFLGTVFDIVSDRMVEFSVVFGLFILYPAHALFLILMLGSILICMTTFLVVGIFTQNDSQKGFFYSRGIIERPETFLFFILMILFPKGLDILAAMFVILVITTAMVRLYGFAQQQNKEIKLETKTL